MIPNGFWKLPENRLRRLRQKTVTFGGAAMDISSGVRPIQRHTADGAFGQVTTVLPEKGLAIAVQCPEWGDFDKVKLALHEVFFSQL